MVSKMLFETSLSVAVSNNTESGVLNTIPPKGARINKRISANPDVSIKLKALLLIFPNRYEY